MVDDELEPLITRCPNCSTQFRVTESQLAAASGRVRCGACLTVFEGTDYLILDQDTAFRDGVEADAALDALLDELGSAGTVSAAESASAAPVVDLALTQDTPVIYGGFEEEAVESVEHAESVETVTDDEPIAADRTDLNDEAIPSEAETEPDTSVEADYEAWIRPGTPEIDQMVDEVVSSGVAGVAEASREEDGFHLAAVERALEEEGVGTRPISFAPEPRRWWVVGVAALLALVLAVQIFYLQLPEWSRDPGTRGMYVAVCGLLGCDLPEIRALDALRTRNLMVRSHPEFEDALVVDAVIVNQADFEQRFPGLELRFTSVGGLLVAGRTFQPEEYLAGEMGAGDLMPVDTPVQVSLEISDPGDEAVNYTLNFR